jgi:hypothetical protein
LNPCRWRILLILERSSGNVIYFASLQNWVVSLSIRDEYSLVGGELAFSMIVSGRSRRVTWIGKHCIARTVSVNITENLLKLHG